MRMSSASPVVSTTVSSLYITMDNELVFFFNYPWHNWSAQRPRRENPPEMMSLLVLRWRPKSPTSFSISWKSEIQISHNILWHHWTTNHICRFLKGKLKKKLFSFHQCIPIAVSTSCVRVYCQWPETNEPSNHCWGVGEWGTIEGGRRKKHLYY